MMAGFTESALSKKLADLNSSQQSIQTLSLWLIHHRKHHAAIVKVWFKDFLKSNASRKLTFMYLANDVIQNSKRKGPEFGKEFGSVLKKAFEHFSLPECDEKTIRNLNRILQVWEERGVYDSKMIKEFKKALEPPDREPTPPKKKVKLTPSFVPEVEKPAKKEKTIKVKVVPREHKKSETEVEVDGTKELHVTLSPHTPSGDPPEPEELIKALMELENSASSDAAVRERIASLPPEVSEVSLLTKLEDKATAEKLAVQVNEAVQLLLEYNGRLAAEMEDRKKVSSMMRDFIQAQRELYAQAEQRLEFRMGWCLAENSARKAAGATGWNRQAAGLSAAPGPPSLEVHDWPSRCSFQRGTCGPAPIKVRTGYEPNISPEDDWNTKRNYKRCMLYVRR